MNDSTNRPRSTRLAVPLLALLACTGCFVPLSYHARAGEAGRGVFQTGQYRNLFVEADRLLSDLRHRQLITGPTIKGPMTAGAIFEPRLKMIRFTPDVANWNPTDPSYHVPAFYELWARWGPEGDREFWRQAAEVSRDFFHRVTHPATGLAPDYANFDATPWAAPWSPPSADFQYDSWRTAMNWSVDWAWWAQDPRQPELSDRLQRFFEGEGLGTYGHRYALDGRKLGHDHPAGLVAMNAVAGMAATHPRARQLVEAFWNTPIPSGRHRYYDGMLYLLGLLHCGGEFKIWPPP